MNTNLNRVTNAIRQGGPRQNQLKAQRQAVQIEQMPEPTGVEHEAEHELCVHQPGPVRAAITALLASGHPEALERATRLSEYMTLQLEATPAALEPAPLTQTIDRDALVKVCQLVTTFNSKVNPDAVPVTFDTVVDHVVSIIDGFKYCESLVREHADTIAQMQAERRTELGGAKTLAERVDTERDSLRQVVRAVGRRAKAPEWAMKCSSLEEVEQVHKAFEQWAQEVTASSAQVAEHSIPLSELRLFAASLRGIENTAGPVDPIADIKQLVNGLAANQKPDGWDQATQTLVNANQRYEAVLAAIQNVLTLK